MELQGNKISPRFEITLGEGTYGVVKSVEYSANNYVAMKEYYTSDPSIINELYFLTELEDADGIPKLIDLHNGSIIMEQIHIKAWDEFTKDEIYKLVPIMVEKYSSILDIIHSKGIIHGDITRENIVIDYNGKFWILDFGIASYSTKCTGYNIFYSDRIPHYNLLGSKKTKDGWTDKWMLGRAILKIISNVVPELQQTEAYHFICNKNVVTNPYTFSMNGMCEEKISLMIDDDSIKNSIESLLILDPTSYPLTQDIMCEEENLFLFNHIQSLEKNADILIETLVIIDKLADNNIKPIMKFLAVDILRTYLDQRSLMWQSKDYEIFHLLGSQDDNYIALAVIDIASNLLFGSNKYRNFGLHLIVNINYDKLHNMKMCIMEVTSFRPISLSGRKLLMTGALII